MDSAAAGSRRQSNPETRAAGSRPRTTQPIPGTGSRQRPPGPAGSGSRRAQNYPFRDTLRRRKRNQRIAVWIGVVALVAAGASSIIIGQSGGSSAPQKAAAASSSAASSAAAGSSAAASSSSSAAPSSTAASTFAAPGTPAMAMTCPSGGGASPVFGHQISATEPYSVTITYGDGDKYTDTSAHLGAIFSHTYKAKGTYTVNAVLTDPAKRTTSATCTYVW